MAAMPVNTTGSFILLHTRSFFINPKVYGYRQKSARKFAVIGALNWVTNCELQEEI